MDLTEHATRNRAQWNEWANDYVAPAEANWSASEPTWGIWGIPEPEAKVFGDGGIEQW